MPGRTKEVPLRKVVAVELLSVDGVMESPETWAFPYSDEEMEEANASGMSASDALLLGRVTYEALAAFWPHQPGGTPMVDYINSVAKYVVSGTLEEPLGWNNSTLIEGNVTEGIDELKQRAALGFLVVLFLKEYQLGRAARRCTIGVAVPPTIFCLTKGEITCRAN